MPAHPHPTRAVAGATARLRAAARRHGPLALALSAVTVLAACGGSDAHGTITEITAGAPAATSSTGEQPAVIHKPDPSTPASTKATDQLAAPATEAPNYRPISENPSQEKGLDFGFLTRIVSRDGVVTLQFDRAAFYTGAQAVAHNGGQEVNGDYLIQNTNQKKRTFTVDPKVSIQAQNQLLADPGVVEVQTLTVAELIQNAAKSTDLKAGGIPVWLRHTGGINGPVTALQEQYLP